MLCPICKKGKLINMGLLTCCYCQKMWTEPEFLGECKNAGLSYYLSPNINGTITIYDPKLETHGFIEAKE